MVGTGVLVLFDDPVPNNWNHWEVTDDEGVVRYAFSLHPACLEGVLEEIYKKELLVDLELFIGPVGLLMDVVNGEDDDADTD